MEDVTCDHCGQPAVVHLTEIRFGIKTHRHLCRAHAEKEGENTLVDDRGNSSAQEASTERMIETFAARLTM